MRKITNKIRMIKARYKILKEALQSCITTYQELLEQQKEVELMFKALDGQTLELTVKHSFCGHRYIQPVNHFLGNKMETSFICVDCKKDITDLFEKIKEKDQSYSYTMYDYDILKLKALGFHSLAYENGKSYIDKLRLTLKGIN